MKLLGILFFRRFHYYLPGARIVAWLAAVATTLRTRLSPRLPTTTRLRFLLDLHLNVSLALQILCILYSKRSSLSEPLVFLALRRLLSASFAARRLWFLCLLQYQLMHDPGRLDLLAVCRLERAETSNIKWLEDVRRVGRHAEHDDAVELEVGRVVAVVAVEDEEAINPGYSSFGMPVEVLNPF
ncbi:hypothetical protein B0T22DRAFT_241101 [Podospora appendiculata]|uniref:Uncharacterized protein n=1 Tax=Podospora appendiculata TaxID=314037 RepID=A0AAE0X6H9_9PEZI|nr:hypothetical protein B0T22DRAFT_241101 [Podospora appendiculata]